MPNELVNASYSLNRHETDLVLMALGMLNTTQVQRTDTSIKFDLNELYEASRVSTRKDNYINQIKQAIQSLSTKSISLIYPQTRQFRILNWISEVSGYLADETGYSQDGRVELFINPRVVELFSEITGNYTVCNLRYALQLESQYSKRVYQIALQYKNMEIPAIPLDQLKDMLGVNEYRWNPESMKVLEEVRRYPMYAKFRKYVLEPVVKDINQNTDITISYKPVCSGFGSGQGKKVHAIKFKYKFKSDQAEQEYQPKTSRRKPKKKHPVHHLGENRKLPVHHQGENRKPVQRSNKDTAAAGLKSIHSILSGQKPEVL